MAKKRTGVVKAVFRGLSRMQSNYVIEIGPVRAKGVPAILVAVGGIVIGSGIAAVLAKNAERLPETLREARGLAETLRGDRRRLNP
ncbi:MAG TPA: hypothetical protein VFN49_08655 [Candidatus Aquilonibacter sp.]|nr:hypothetical protein [Candidatus Aquilonibacter sp.]